MVKKVISLPVIGFQSNTIAKEKFDKIQFRFSKEP